VQPNQRQDKEPAATASPAAAARPGLLAAFSYPAFRYLWLGAFLSSVGTWIQDVALSWLIHERMGDPSYLGLRSFAQEMPLIAFMLIGGAAADRIDRRLILLSSQTFQMAMAILLGVLYLLDRLGIVAIVAIAFATGLMQSQSAPTYQAVITSLVPRERIANAVALNSFQFNLSRAIGPVIAGVLLAQAGAGFCFAANALSFVAVILALWTIALPPPPPRSGESLADSLRAGVRHVASDRRLRGATLLAGAASFLAFPLITYLPVIAGDVLRTGASGYSLLLTSVGIGAIAGALTTARRGHAPGRGRLMLLAFLAFGVLAAAAALSRRQWLSMPLLVGAGFMLTTAFSTLNSLVQEMAPDALRGRVLSIFGLAFRGGGPLGSLIAGFLVRAQGAPPVMAAYAATLALVAGVLLLRQSDLGSAATHPPAPPLRAEG
jgi:predicted MFS family arabinose efflux permease